jgi:hypothetical protein
MRSWGGSFIFSRNYHAIAHSLTTGAISPHQPSFTVYLVIWGALRPQMQQSQGPRPAACAQARAPPHTHTHLHFLRRVQTPPPLHATPVPSRFGATRERSPQPVVAPAARRRLPRLVTALPGLARPWGPGAGALAFSATEGRVPSATSANHCRAARVVPAPGATVGNTPQTTVPPPRASPGSAQAWRSFKLESCPIHALSWAFLPTPESSSVISGLGFAAAGTAAAVSGLMV